MSLLKAGAVKICVVQVLTVMAKQKFSTSLQLLTHRFKTKKSLSLEYKREEEASTYQKVPFFFLP